MSSTVKNVDSLNFSGKKALIRVDFNVPLDDKFNVTDDTRIQAAVPTIKKILSEGGSAILMSHLGRPKGGPEDKYSLKHIISAVEAALGAVVIGDGAIVVVETVLENDRHGRIAHREGGAGRQCGQHAGQMDGK